MHGTAMNNAIFTEYEYREISISRAMEGVYLDGYPNFGWQLDSAGNRQLRFKRERRIRNKGELSRLQRKFDEEAHQIEQLEKGKARKASIASVLSGFIATAGATGLMLLLFKANVLPMTSVPIIVLLIVPGLVGQVCSFSIFEKISNDRKKSVEELTAKHRDEMHEICESAHALLTY